MFSTVFLNTIEHVCAAKCHFIGKIKLSLVRFMEEPESNLG